MTANILATILARSALITDILFLPSAIIATATIRFIVTVAIAIYKGSIPVARQMLTTNTHAERTKKQPQADDL